MRIDILAIPVIALGYHYTFGEQVFDSEHILASVALLGCISLVFLLFLLNFWSVNANVFI